MKANFFSLTITDANAITPAAPRADVFTTPSNSTPHVSTPVISPQPAPPSASERAPQSISSDPAHLDEAYHQQHPHLKTARTYTPWNHHLHPHHTHNSKTAPPTKSAQAQYYDPPALDAYRLYHAADPPGQLRNWDASGEEILAAEWDPRVEGWKWVMVGDASEDVSGSGGGKEVEEKYIEEWMLMDVEKALLEEVGVGEGA